MLYPNLILFLKGKYAQSTKEQTLDGFVEFAKNYLANNNQPIRVEYAVERGIGLKLQHGETVVFTDSIKPIGDMLPDSSIPVTRLQSIPGRADMMPDTSIPITGNK